MWALRSSTANWRRVSADSVEASGACGVVLAAVAFALVVVLVMVVVLRGLCCRAASKTAVAVGRWIPRPPSVLDQKFAQSVKQTRNQSQILDKKFEEAQKRAKADPNRRASNPFDFD